MPQRPPHSEIDAARDARVEHGPPPGAADALIARQPILDLRQQLHGYELLCRDATPGLDSKGDPTRMTRLTIHNALHVIGFETLVGSARAYVQVTPDNLRDQDYLVLPPGQTALQLNAAGHDAADLTARCRDAIDAGFPLVIRHDAGNEPHGPLLDLAAAVKVDVRSIDPQACRSLLNDCRARRIDTIAAKVETQEEFRAAAALGFRYVQGFFFCEPQVLSRRALIGHQALCLQLLAELGRPALDMDRIEDLIQSDVALSCGLLRYLNSAALGLGHRIDSIRQAMLMLGERPLRKWAAMASVSALGKNKPHQLLLTALTRARFCEQLAERLGMEAQALNMYLAGLLSTIDAILDLPMEEVIAMLPVSENIIAALTGHGNGPLASALPLAKASERGAWNTVNEYCLRVHLTQREVAQIHYSSLTSVNKLFAAA